MKSSWSFCAVCRESEGAVRNGWALSLFAWDGEKLEALSENLRTLKQRVRKCPQCGNLAGDDTEDGLCMICISPVRDASVVCVVEEATQIRSIEASGVFKGLYHVLGGRIAPLEGKGIESIDVDGLEKQDCRRRNP